MGRDWYKLGGGGRRGGSKRKGDAAERNVSDDSHWSNNTRTAASGCIATLFQLLDFHRFHLYSHHHQSSSSSSSKPTVDFSPKSQKGLAAPRNISELTESPSSATDNEQQRLSNPMGTQVEIKAMATRSKLGALTKDTSCSSSEIISFPSAKTPNLVARLMGLDLLPDDNTDHNHSSPNLHKMSHHIPRMSFNGKITGTMSLPESPRLSSARRSDFDLHRHFLQLNIENKCEECGCSRLKNLRQEDEKRNPQEHARQIVNHIKEKVSMRRIGTDITNTVKNRETEAAKNHHEIQKKTVLSCSPRKRLPQKENKAYTNTRKTFSSMSKTDQISQKPLSSPPMMPTTVLEPKAPRALQEQKREKQHRLRPINEYKKADSDTKFSLMPWQRSNTRNKQKEIFVRTSTNTKANHNNPLGKKVKKTTLSNYVDEIFVAPVVPVKKIQSPPAQKRPQKRLNGAQAPKWNSKQSISSSQTYKHEENLPQVTRHTSVDDATAVAAAATTTAAEITEFNSEYKYITRILSYASITETDSPISSILDNTLKPQKKLRPAYHGLQPLDELCSTIRSYPRASFRLIEDTDTPVAGILPETKKFKEEGEEIVAEIEREITDALVFETASYFVSETTSRFSPRAVQQNGAELV